MTQAIRENRFLFSTDYMHIANFGQTKQVVSIPPVQMPADRPVDFGYVDVNLPVPQGSIPRTIIQFQGASMDTPSYVSTNGYFRIEEMWDNLFYWDIFWYRLDNSKVRFEYTIRRVATGWEITTPSLVFTVIQQYLKAPDA